MSVHIERPDQRVAPRVAFAASLIVNLLSWPLLPRLLSDAVGPVIFAAVPAASVAVGVVLAVGHATRRVGLAVVAGALVGVVAAFVGLLFVFLSGQLGE